MNEQLLKDFIATAQKYNYDWNKTFELFPELKGYDQQLLKDYVATAEQDNYDYSIVNPKFPELGFVKKKEQAAQPQPTAQAQPMAQKPQAPAAMESSSGAPSSASPSTEVIGEEFKGFDEEALKRMKASATEAPQMALMRHEKKAEKQREEDRAQVLAEIETWKDYKEQPYFEGELGNTIRAIPFGLGGFIDDMGRAVGAGATQADIASPSNSLMISGPSSSPEQIKKYVEVQKVLDKYGPSEEMVAFTKAIEEDNGGAWGFIKGLIQNPSVVPEVMISSVRALLNPTSAAAAGTVVGGAAAGGSAFGGVGAGPAALASIPWAMSAAGATLETASSFAEFMNEELQKRGLELSEENVKTILEDEDALSRMRNRALTRGATVTVFDGFTGRIAGRVGANLGKGAGMASKIKAGLASAGIEAVGGSAGEATARALAGQEMDIAEIGLEGVGEMPMATIDVAAEVLRSPRYKINGEVRNAEDVQSIINTASADELQNINFDIKNDRNGFNQQIQDKIVTNQVRNEIKDASPDIDDESLNQLTTLEMELRKVEGNKTQTGRDKANQIRSQIREVQQAAAEKKAAAIVETAPAETKPAPITAEQVALKEEEAAIAANTLRAEILDDIFKDSTAQNKADALEQRMNNAEEIPMTEINDVLDGLYKQVEMVMDNYFDNEVGKQYAQALLDKIDKIKSYEFATDKETAVITERTAVQTARNTVQETASVINLARAPRRKATITSEDGTTGTYSIEVGPDGAVTFEQPDAEPIRVGNVNDVNKTTKIVETVLNEKGLPQSVSFSITDEQGKSHTIKVEAKANLKPQQLLDLAINIRANELGTVDPTDFDTAYQEVTKEVTTTKLVSDAIQKQTAGQVPVQPTARPSEEVAQGEPQAESQVTAQAGVQEEVSRLEQAFGGAFAPTPSGGVSAQTQKPSGVSVSNREQVAELETKTTDTNKKKIIKAATTAINTLKSIFPDMDIVIHESNDSYTKQVGQSTRGNFEVTRTADGKIVGGRIDINLSKANMRTVAHEVAHAVMLKAFGDNPALFKVFRDRITNILSETRIKSLNDFVSQYAENDSHEEFLVELSAALGEAQEQLKPITVNKITQLINKVVSKITGGKVQPFSGIVQTNELIDFMNTMSSAIGRGEAIQVKEGETKGAAGVVSKAQLATEGTGVKLSGNEPLVKGKNAPTVSTNTKGYIEDYSVDDIMNTIHAPNSRVVSLSSNIASGQITYTKDGEKITLELPYKNINLKNRITELRLQYKAIKSASKEAKAQKNKLKAEINKVAKKIISDFTDLMSQNLLALYDTLTPDFIKNSKEWYVGANRMANSIANKYKMSVEQVSGIIAVLSPQNDWFNNVSVAERTIEIMDKYSDTKLTKDIVDKAVAYNTDKSTGEKNNFAMLISEFFNKNGEVSINDLQSVEDSIEVQALILRAFDHAFHSPKVAMTDPTGKFFDYDKTPVRWNSSAEIAKAIVIYRNGDISNINENLGDGNKVRNFYNNIVDPNSQTPYVTADTHALSAALNSPMSANDAGGFGLFNGSLEPLYAMVKGAYINAANIAGIMPREMQSITWEAQRIGINDKSRTEETKNNVFDYIAESRKNKQTPYERATELIARNRSGNPSWGKSRGIETQKSSEEIRRDVGSRANKRIGSLSDLRGRTKGGLGKSRPEMGGGIAEQQGLTTVSKAQIATEVKEMGETFTVSKAQKADEEVRKVVKDARAQGYSEAAIKAFLVKKGFTEQEADALMSKPEAAKKVTMTEKNLLKIKIKEYARGAKDTKTAIANATKELTDMLAEMVNGGKISSAQLRTIIRKFGSLKVLNEKSLNRFFDYMTKVIADAEYSSKLENAQSLRKAIKKLSRNKEKNASMRELAKRFVDIDPSLVDDIDAYNDIAQKIKESVKGSTIREGKITQAEMVNIEDSNEYISETMDAQRQKLFDEKAAEIQELLGVDVSDLSYEQLLEMVDKKEKITKYNEGLVRSATIRMFGTYSSIIEQMFSTSKDPFTGEDIDIDPKKKELVQRFMDMDLNQFTAKQGLEAVDALTNFIQNGSTAKMEAVVSEYTGEKNAMELEEKGVKSESLKAYWSKGIGRFFGEQFMSLPVLLDRMFKGVKKASLFEKMSGLIELRNKKSAADRKVTDIINDYVDKFYKEKANGEDFNTSYNATERGLVAFMTRTIIGNAKEQQVEFNVRKKFIEESIDVLSKGTDKEKLKAELYQKAYDKLLKDSKNGDEVRSKADKKNLEAVDYWKNKWAEIYDDLSDVSENVYNTILDKDLNYTPDRYTRLDSAGERTPLENDQSMFHGNTNTIYKKKTGSLMEVEKKEEGDVLPREEGKKKPSMYVDLSFDRNNANSMYDALVDINTAATIRQVEAFINSESFDSIIDNPKDAKLLNGRIQQFVRNMRDKNIVESDELSKMARSLNVMATIGVGQALGGVFQPFKQTIPVIVNTMINAGKINMSVPFTSAVNDFLNNSGYAIANRGLASSTEISSIEKLADLGESSLGEKALKKIEAANKKMLEILLVKADIAVARASWIAYYEKSLQEQGIDTKGIDYTTHELNKEAADYAQRMVDRQQNISDHDLAGKMFTSKAPMNQLFVKAVMPFASFRINQWMRMTTDLSTLKSKTATKEDKRVAARSLAGFTAEMFTFKLISFGLIVLMGTLTKALMGHDEDEEEEKKRIANAKKGVLTGTVTDVFSPVPFADKAIQMGGAWLLDKVQSIMDIAEEEKVSIYGTQKSDIFTGLGSLGIAGERLYQMVELISLSTNGKFKDDYGNEKQVSEQDMEVLKAMIGLSILSTVGLAPSEVNTIVRNSIKFAKKGGKTEKSIKAEQFSPPNGLTKEQFKRYFPEEYEEKYGEGSMYYKMTQPEREQKKKAEDEKQKLMDEYYDYEEKSKKGFGSKGFGEEKKKKEGFGSKGFGSKGFGEKD